MCAAALLCHGTALRAAESEPSNSASASNFPVASDARLAGDGKQTRFVLDLDKAVRFRAFTLADPYRVVLDIPQVTFQLPPGIGTSGRGLVKAFRYGLVMPGGSRMVFDLTGPAKIAKAAVLDAAYGQPARLVLEFEETDRTSFVQLLRAESRPELRPGIGIAVGAIASAGPAGPLEPPAMTDPRPVVVIDPGHGGIDNGTQTSTESEKNLVLGFGLALRERLEKSGKYRVVMTCTDDTFIPLDDVSGSHVISRRHCLSRFMRMRCRAERATPRAPRSTRCPIVRPTPKLNGSPRLKTRPTRSEA